MQLVDSNKTIEVPPGTQINYYTSNPLLIATGWVQTTTLAAELEYYLMDQTQYLFGIQTLELWGPSGTDFAILDPRFQDNKTDFQKQNLKSLFASDLWMARGWATVDGWTGSFLRISYEGGPDSALARAAGGNLGSSIQLYLKVGPNASNSMISVPYNPSTSRYEIELWAYPCNDLLSKLDDKGVTAFKRGELLARPDLIRGAYSDFAREGKDGVPMTQVAPDHTMHPILPLSVEVAWSDNSGQYWDSKGGGNYHYQFNMILRGWNQYLGVGISESPHGGVGFLHYRNLLSNYFGYGALNELGREVDPWMFDAYGHKPTSSVQERSFTMDYLDLHIVRPQCGIGLHRHRDNQEIFFLTTGTGLMFCGDWCQFPTRERSLEARYLYPGSFSLIKPGGFHGLLNATDENLSLLMFGGYD